MLRAQIRSLQAPAILQCTKSPARIGTNVSAPKGTLGGTAQDSRTSVIFSVLRGNA
jgi:hypothetical protein